MSDVFTHLFSPDDSESRLYGVAIGIVTNNKDPDGLGRVKVKLPWMAADLESDWARVVTPMAGARRGMYFIPEVDDEVLVAFEHGSAEHPYVLGALWNGEDKPPESNRDGKNNTRTIRSRSGHLIRLTDTDGEERIEIVDKSTKNSIVINSKDNTITITADADVTIRSAQGKVKLAGKGVEITSQAGIKIEASQNVDLKAGGQLNAKGSVINLN
jgi:phage baseplate assembly protein V